MVAEKASDLQMPFYMLFAWTFAKAFGTAEWVMRAANIPWFVAGLLAFVVSLPEKRRPIGALLGVLSSFVWFYLDEARPYAMQLGAAFMIVASVKRLTEGVNAGGQFRARWAWGFCAGVGVLAGTSLLGIVWCMVAVVILLLLAGLRNARPIFNGAVAVWLLLLAWVCALAAYYVWTLKIGARASASVATNWQSVLFVMYELLGLGGLGPGRLEIREAGLASFRPHVFPLALHCVVVLVMAVVGAATVCRRNFRLAAIVFVCVACAFMFLVASGWLLHFRILGRHCAPMLPVLLLLLLEGCSTVLDWRKALGRTLVGVLLFLCLASCLSLRFATRHGKDDYRGAVALARAALADGKSVWWCAEPHAAEFYGLQLQKSDADKAAAAQLILNPSEAEINAVPLPDVIVMSKPDLFDSQGAVAGRLSLEGRLGVFDSANPRAFRIWRKAKSLNPR